MIRWTSFVRNAPARHVPGNARRWLSAQALDERLAEPVQSYVSTSHDPYLNLSIEHYLLQRSAPESTILFLYVNRPSIIIGRNQNPWLEVNLSLLNQTQIPPAERVPGPRIVELVRRRSGGGTVFHDEGNVNWTVICPSAAFTRDKHAEMVVRALRECGIERARVNERHDIVLDQGERKGDTDPADAHSTPYTDVADRALLPLKVSGSAYKLTRNRALHHGTCLLSSPNLHVIPHYLHSPARPHIRARGVESVSSPVSNVALGNDEFTAAVQRHFARQHRQSTSIEAQKLDEGLLSVQAVNDGFTELQSLEWTYLQTPQFTITGESGEWPHFDLEMTVRHGVITDAVVQPLYTGGELPGEKFNMHLRDHRLHDITRWQDILVEQPLDEMKQMYVASWLQRMLPRVPER